MYDENEPMHNTYRNIMRVMFNQMYGDIISRAIWI